MLYYRFDRIFKARGIDQPFTYMINAGFSVAMASKIKNNHVVQLKMHHLERFCLLLKCTPNDLLEWVPDKNAAYDDNHPLKALKRSEIEVDMVKTINSIPLNKLEQIEKLIREELQKQNPAFQMDDLKYFFLFGIKKGSEDQVSMPF